MTDPTDQSAQPASDESPGTGAAELERSQQLIDEARDAAKAAEPDLPQVHDDDEPQPGEQVADAETDGEDPTT